MCEHKDISLAYGVACEKSDFAQADATRKGPLIVIWGWCNLCTKYFTPAQLVQDGVLVAEALERPDGT